MSATKSRTSALFFRALDCHSGEEREGRFTRAASMHGA